MCLNVEALHVYLSVISRLDIAMLPDFFESAHIPFETDEAFTARLAEAVEAHLIERNRTTIGESEEQRPLYGYRMGQGPDYVSLIAGAHADEPVGPQTLRTLVFSMLTNECLFEDLLRRFTFLIVPHVNPDGEQRNQRWIEKWPDVSAYLQDVVREGPGFDIEFSYPDRRAENRAVIEFIRHDAPIRLHVSLHGMGFSDGAMLLIDKNWSYRTDRLQEEFSRLSSRFGFSMHDHNRKGEKGFFQIGPGFTTTPEGRAMRTYFLSRGDPDMADLFGDSSMEAVQSMGGDPLCLVTELPLFLVDGPSEPGIPSGYLEFVQSRPGILNYLSEGGKIDSVVDRFGLTPVPLRDAMAIQWKTIGLGLEQVALTT